METTPTNAITPDGAPSRTEDSSQKPKVPFIGFASVLIAVVISHLVAAQFGLQTGKPTYRRIGPTEGPQMLCAGSSLIQFGLSWSQISVAFGQGIENWGVGGSSPEIWEVSQSVATNVNSIIIGVSVYDLNEQQLCDSRAHIVPFGQTLSDLWQAKADWAFSKRILSMYPLAFLRSLIPTAGRSDAVLVGMRRKFRDLAGLGPSAEDKGNSLVLPQQAVLEFGDSTEKMSDWPKDKLLRRVAMQRSQIFGTHTFDGPKKLAFHRMLKRAQNGRTIVVVLPVSPSYGKEFLAPEVLQNFEASLEEAKRADSRAVFIRLDQVAALQSDEFFSDLVHLNGAGREIATAAFFEELKRQTVEP